MRRACHYETRADHQTGAERSFETRVARSFVERTRPRYAARARRVVTFVSEASGENRVADRLDSAVATRVQDWDHVYPAVRRMAGMQA